MIRKLCVSMLAVAALSVCAWAQNPPAGSPVARHGQLRQDGNKIVDKNGDPVTLRGMSLYWSISRSARSFYTAATVQNLRDEWKATVIRAAMGVEANWAGDEQGYISDAAGNRTRVETVVDAAIALGMYVIIDWHSHEAERHQASAISFFQAMATKYKSYPNIIYEIYNEPIDQSWSTIKSYSEAVIGAIRAIDPNNMILVGNRQYCQYPNEAAANPPKGSNGQPFANMAMVVHFYSAQEGHKGDLRSRVGLALNSGFPVFASEFGITMADGGGAIDTVEANRWFEYMDEKHIGWANWSLSSQSETSAALTGGASVGGPWANNLTTSGRYISNKLKFYASNLTVATTVAGNTGGTINISPPAPHTPGQTVSITAAPSDGWRFEGWTGDLLGTEATQSLFLNGNKSVTAVFFKNNLLNNSTFTIGGSGWSVTASIGSAGNGEAVNGEYRANITTVGTNNRNLRLQQTGITLTNGRRYRLSFKARAVSGTRKITPVVANASGTNFMVDTAAVTLTAQEQTFEKTFDMAAATSTAAVVAFYYGAEAGSWIIDDIMLEDVGPGSSVAAVSTPQRTTWTAVRANGGVQLRGPNVSGATAALYDTRGRMVRTMAARDGLAITGVPSGNYVLVVKNSGRDVYSTRVVMGR